MHLRRHRHGLILALAVAVLALTAFAPSARADITCPTVLDAHHNPTGSARCAVKSGVFTYYQAIVTKNNDCSSIGTTLYSTIRVQVLARRGSTGVIVEGVWVVYNNGPRRFGSMRFDAIDGNNAHHNGHWNYAGGWSNPEYGYTYLADSFTGAPIRYGASPSSQIGLPWGRNNSAMFLGQFAMADNPFVYLQQAACRMNPVSVVFTP